MEGFALQLLHLCDVQQKYRIFGLCTGIRYWLHIAYWKPAWVGLGMAEISR
jgi:hypothetical protein